MKGCIVYGGSFNPVHIGHLRLAIETSWMLSELAERLEFVPTARHPQKSANLLLPIDMRMEMIRCSLSDLPDMSCNGLEKERAELSYTFDTLKDYLQNWPGIELYFLLGSEDYFLLNTWHKWTGLATLCNLVVLPRGKPDTAKFTEITSKFWPRFGERLPLPAALDKKNPGCLRLSISPGTSAYYLPAPWLPVSSSQIRELWRQGRNPEWLMPPQALAILRRHKKIVDSCWNEKG